VRAEMHKLSLSTEFPGPVPETIETDPTRLRQILINLVGNAIKFTRAGNVRIAAHLHIEKGLPPRMQFDIIDTGIGMSEEQITHVFQPFMQADMSTSRQFGGPGLGLTISRRLAEILGGTIHVQSVLEKGTMFSVLIDPGNLEGVPMLADPAEAVLKRRSLHGEHERDVIKLNGRVLLVEDGIDNQRLIALLLKKAGVEVTVAENGLVALEKIIASQTPADKEQPMQWETFDVILMDMQMPVLDGYETTRRLRTMGYIGPIIALTAHAMSQDRQLCLDAGCDDYLEKPVDQQSLLETIAQYMTVLEPSIADSVPAATLRAAITCPET